jgi:pimeloyl-ACP methyl ester carboxylesterase
VSARASLAGLRTALVGLSVCFATLTWPTVAQLGAAPADGPALTGTPIRSIYVRPPAGPLSGRPLQVLVALHGMGGNGESFARELTEQADKYSWLLVAPTIDYGDWRDPNQVAREDPVLIRALGAYLDELPERSGLAVRREVLLLGHSRGAQLAHRFAEFRPDRVLAVAALAAGTYTMPGTALSFPFGVKDLASYTGRPFDSSRFDDVPFWVGVGGDDTNPSDLPRQWDAVEGTTRVERARSFQSALHALGAHALLRVFGGAQHNLTSEMQVSACSFLNRVAVHGSSLSGGRLASAASRL